MYITVEQIILFTIANHINLSSHMNSNARGKKNENPIHMYVLDYTFVWMSWADYK